MRKANIKLGGGGWKGHSRKNKAQELGGADKNGGGRGSQEELEYKVQERTWGMLWLEIALRGANYLKT